MYKKVENNINPNMPIITIGIPVYNGEKFIQKCIESVLQQTYRNFELIISDNASIDSTTDICNKFLKKDDRIKFFKQNKNMGANWNFNFLLEKSIGKYFVWVAADNIILPEFIEKSIAELESQEKIVGCISKIKIDEVYIDQFKKEKQILNRMGIDVERYGPYNTLSITGNYIERIRKYLKYFPWEMFYAVYRTKALRESFVHDFFVGSDASLVLNILKYGEIKVIDEILMQSFPAGMSSNGINQLSQKIAENNFETIFPFYRLTKWCVSNLGWKVFFNNFDHFLRLGLDGIILQLIGNYQKTKK